jgi:hypothetical protein
MSIKLTDTQLVLLSAASQREDHYLTPPSGSRLASAKKSAASVERRNAEPRNDLKAVGNAFLWLLWTGGTELQG